MFKNEDGNWEVVESEGGEHIGNGTNAYDDQQTLNS